jgi:hypothetical protein
MSKSNASSSCVDRLFPGVEKKTATSNPWTPRIQGDCKKMEPKTDSPKEDKSFKERMRAFWDFFVLFSGISTARNLSRTRKNPVLSRGLFLFRSKRPK